MRISFLFRSVVSIFLIFATSFLLLKEAGQRAEENYLNIASMQGRKIANSITAKTIDALLEENVQERIIQEKNETTLLFNTHYINALLQKVSNEVYRNLKAVEAGKSDLLKDEVGTAFYKTGIIYEIPFSLIFDNVFLASLGPKLPVRFHLIGDVKADLFSEVTSFGLNNAKIDLCINVEIASRIFIPLSSKTEVHTSSLSIFSMVFEGKVPSFPFGVSTVEGVQQQISEVIPI